MMPNQQLHLDEAVFGSRTKSLIAERFLKDKDLSRSSCLKPFGGGSTYCSGRFIAKRQVMAFVALAVHRYNSHLKNPSQAFPKTNEIKPTLDIMDPVATDRVVLALSSRMMSISYGCRGLARPSITRFLSDPSRRNEVSGCPYH